jgi:hypothetical protein
MDPVEIGKQLIGTSKLPPTPFLDNFRVAGYLGVTASAL